MREILIADDHPLFREALRGAVLRAVPEATPLEAASVGALLEALDAHPQCELLLLDLNMPGANGFSALVHVRASHPAVPVVVVSAREDADTIRRALGHGAAGFIPKSADLGTMCTALERILDGGTWAPADVVATPLAPDEARLAQALAALTPAQFRVLGMVCAGLLNKQIAWELSITEATVKAHMSAVLRKLGVHTRTQAVMLAGKLALDPGAVRAPPEGD
ncbi:MAG TPA: response regulator transcription factor [Pseudomonadota bacterium]|nr:response regulator transcription factor [Pseudomonadota bacterium]